MRVSPPNRGRNAAEQSWPSDVWNVGLDRLDYLGVDKHGQLYWNGQKIQLEELKLTRWQKLGTVLITISAMVAACAASVSAWSDYQDESRNHAAIAAASVREDAERAERRDAATRRYAASIKAREDAAADRKTK